MRETKSNSLRSTATHSLPRTRRSTYSWCINAGHLCLMHQGLAHMSRNCQSQRPSDVMWWCMLAISNVLHNAPVCSRK